VAIADIEEIYYENLKQFLLTKNDLERFNKQATETISQKQEQMETLKKNRLKVKEEMSSILQLHHKGQIPTSGFKEFYDPLDTQLKQIDTTIAETESQLDILKVTKLDGEHILDNAESLYERWETFDLTVKRRIVEDLTKSIVVGSEDITITFGYEPKPSLIQNTPKGQRNVTDSCSL
jgi:site-specific DNA recombinase